MLIFGVFVKYKWRDEKTGRSTFLLKTEDGNFIFCHGTFPPMSSRMPVKLEGEYTSHSDFEVKKSIFCGYNAGVMKNYLLKAEFRKAGEAAINKILDETDVDLFDYVRNSKDIEETLNKLKYKTDTVRYILLKLKEKTDIETVLLHILDLGGSYHNAIKLYEKLKTNIITQISNNPYLMLEADVPFGVVEKHAHSIGMKPFARQRLTAIVSNTIYRNRKNGNTRITFHQLVENIHRNEKRIGCYYTDTIFIADVLTSEKYIVVEECDDFYVYTADDYRTETAITGNLFRLKKASTELPFTDEHISIAEKECHIKYSDDQKEAFNLLKTSGVKIVTGGPGTGKTTFLNGCINIFKKIKPYAGITLCAPTGCAAARMHDSTGMPASTIHKLLGIKGGVCDETINKLTDDLIVVDEMSMVPANIFSTLLDAVKNGATVLLLGDKDQLPSIGAGDVLNNLIQSGEIETYHLSTIFRVESGNLIVDNARAIINGDVNLKTDKKFHIKRFRNEDEMLNDLTRLCEKFNSDYTVFTAARKIKYKSGTISLNRLIHKPTDDENCVTYGYYTFHVGDRIIFQENDYDKGYYNGEVGTITNIQRIGDSVEISIKAEDDMIYLKDAEISNIELGYAMTAHKAQGSECDNAIIVISKEPHNMLQRKLLYVEVTRAKKAVLILSERNALEECITNDYTSKRDCGLCERIKDAFKPITVNN